MPWVSADLQADAKGIDDALELSGAMGELPTAQIGGLFYRDL